MTELALLTYDAVVADLGELPPAGVDPLPLPTFADTPLTGLTE